MPLDMSIFGKRLSTARDACGFSQSELARISGVGQNQISNLEAGKKPSVRADTVVRLCEALKVRADYLLGMEMDSQTQERQGQKQAGMPPSAPRQRTRKTASVA